MSRRTDRDQRRVALGLRLLDAVDRLEADGDSFTTLSVERIAAEAGAGRSTFYLYFQDKSELLESWFAPIADEIDEAGKGWKALDGSVAREDLLRVIEGVWAVHRRHAAALRIVYDATANDHLVRKLVAEMTDRNVTMLAKHVRAGQRNGFIRKSVLPKETATWLAWMGLRGCHEMLKSATPMSDEALLDGFVEVVWGSLYAPAAELDAA